MDLREEWVNLVNDKSEVVIELGCGNNKRFDDSIGIDKLEIKGVDFVADISKGLTFILDDSVDKIYSNHFLEHIDDLSGLMLEIARVLKPGGLKIGWVPHWSNPYYYSDPTHKTFFGLYTFSYFSNNSIYKRHVPKFYQENFFILEKNLLLMKSTTSNITFFSKVLMKIVNFSGKSQEIFERYFAKIIAVDEVYFHLRKRVI